MFSRSQVVIRVCGGANCPAGPEGCLLYIQDEPCQMSMCLCSFLGFYNKLLLPQKAFSEEEMEKTKLSLQEIIIETSLWMGIFIELSQHWLF